MPTFFGSTMVVEDTGKILWKTGDAGHGRINRVSGSDERSGPVGYYTPDG